jgi:prepilin peptidase CpaA
MGTEVSIAAASAIIIAAVAATTDWRSGTIPNWLTLPTIASAPLMYGFFFGAGHAMQCLVAILVSAFGPFLLFRAGAMGGGDVKLFASLGGVTAFDPRVGLEIELGAFAAAMFLVLCGAAWRGDLLRTLRLAVEACVNRFARRGGKAATAEELLTPIRMGGVILMATVGEALPMLVPHWSRP